MKRRLAVLLACAACVWCLCGCALIESMGSDDPNYEPAKKDPVVSVPAIAVDGTLRVGVNADNAPFSTQVSGKIVGIDVDVAAALATEMGLELQIVDVGSDPEGAISDGSVDVVMGMDAGSTDAAAWLSSAYLPTAVALFAMPSTVDMPAEGDPAVSIEAQSASMSAWEVANQFGETALKSAPDLKTAFIDLGTGGVDYVASDAVIGCYVAYTGGVGARVLGVMQKVGGYCIGVASGNDELKTAVATALETILSNGTVGVIESKWLGAPMDLSSVALTAAAERATNAAAATPVVAEGDQPADEAAAEGEAQPAADAAEEAPADESSDEGEAAYDEAA